MKLIIKKSIQNNNSNDNNDDVKDIEYIQEPIDNNNNNNNNDDVKDIDYIPQPIDDNKDNKDDNILQSIYMNEIETDPEEYINEEISFSKSIYMNEIETDPEEYIIEEISFSESNKFNDKDKDKDEDEDEDEPKKILYEILSELKQIKNDIKELKESKNTTNIMPKYAIYPVKREVLDIPIDKLKYYLSLNDVKGEIYLIKDYYIKGKIKPIRSLSKQIYEYWNGNEWITDRCGRTLIDILINNIKICYTKCNNKENFDYNDIVKNQLYIFNLTKDQYKKNLLKNLTILVVE